MITSHALKTVLPGRPVVERRSSATGRRGLAMKLTAAAASTLLVLILAELLLPLVIPVTDFPAYFWDPAIGPRRAPRQQGRYVRGRDIDVRYRFNAQGWNHLDDYVPAKPPGVQRVCVVGDSFVEALQVSQEQTFFALGERRMKEAGRPAQWYAFGCSGFGTAQDYLLIRHYVLDYHPDVVVVLFVYNDPLDNLPRPELPRAWYTLGAEGGLVLQPIPFWRPPVAWKQAVGHSSLVRYLYVQSGLFHRQTPPRTIPSHAFDAPGSEPGPSAPLSMEQRQQKTWQLVEALLAACKQECAHRGATFALAYYGADEYAEAAYLGRVHTPPRREEDPYCLGTRASEMGREMVGPLAGRLDIPYLDLTATMIEKTKATGRRCFFEGDRHYTATGHEAAAAALSDWIGGMTGGG